jgi:hypothetical protein
MSLYRQAGRSGRGLLILPLVALVVGLGVGFAAGRATAETPTFQDQVADLQAETGTAADALELVAIHYETARSGADAQLERARTAFAEVEPRLRLLSPAETAAAAEAIRRLETLVGENAPAGEVERAAENARNMVRRAARLR